MTTKRYNSGIQRAKGFLELAAALYDSSLSSESWKAAEGVLQTDARLGNAVRLSLTAKSNDKKGLSLSFATGSFREITGVAEGKFSLAWVGAADDGVSWQRSVSQAATLESARGISLLRCYGFCRP